MKRMIRILAVVTLMAVLLVASVSPALARRVAGGIPMPTTKPCEVHSDAPQAQNQQVPRFELRPESEIALCWMVLPNHDE